MGIEKNPRHNPEFEQRKQGLVIVAFGEEGRKVVDGKIQRAIPFVGVEELGEVSQMGVGILLPDAVTKGQFWGLITDKIIQSWRGMKILEHIEEIDNESLSAAWRAGGREDDPIDKIYSSDKLVGKLASKIGKEKFQTLRTKIHNQAPPADELQKMLTTLKDNQVDIDGLELQQEIEAGRVASTPLITQVLPLVMTTITFLL